MIKKILSKIKRNSYLLDVTVTTDTKKQEVKKMKYNRYNNQYSFANVPNVQVQRSKFDRSHNVKTTFNSEIGRAHV